MSRPHAYWAKYSDRGLRPGGTKDSAAANFEAVHPAARQRVELAFGELRNPIPASGIVLTDDYNRWSFMMQKTRGFSANMTWDLRTLGERSKLERGRELLIKLVTI